MGKDRKRLCLLLQPLEVVFNELSHREANASDILKHIFILQKRYNSVQIQGLATTTQKLKTNMENYFDKYIKNENLILATFLDPNHKLRYWVGSHSPALQSTAIKDKLYNKHLELSAHNVDEQPVQVQEEMQEDTDGLELMNNDPDDPQEENDFAELLFPPTVLQESLNLHHLDPKQLFDNELNIYVGSVVPKGVNPLKWWSENANEMPKLACLAKRYLCSPPSSIESERVFSIGGQTYHARRSKLLPKNGEKMITMAFNMRHFSNIKEDKLL